MSAAILILAFRPNQRCAGCGAIGYCETKSLLCLSCVDLRVRVEDRKRKLTSTLAQRFGWTKRKKRHSKLARRGAR